MILIVQTFLCYKGLPITELVIYLVDFSFVVIIL